MRPAFLRNLDDTATEQLTVYARHPSRTGQEVVNWMAGKGLIVPLRTAQHWLASLRRAERARKQQREDVAAKTAAVENLMDYARLIGEARMLRDEEELTPELHEQIVTRFRGLLATIGKSETWAAKSMAISPSTLSQTLSNTYAGDTESIIRRVDKWVEQQHGKLRIAKPEGFVKTSTALAIIGAAKLAIDTNGLTVVYGPSGSGKTLTAKYIASESPGGIFVGITEGTKRPTGLREEIYRALNLPKCKLTVPQMERAIIESLAGKDRLIVVDEVHALVSGRSKEEDSLYMLRRIHDETKSPMVWFGTADLNTYLENGVGIRQGVDQIYSRVVQFLDLATPVLLNEPGPGCHTIDDIRKLVAARGIRITSEGIEYLRDVSNTPGLGALRAVDQLLTYVLTRLKNKDRELTADPPIPLNDKQRRIAAMLKEFARKCRDQILNPPGKTDAQRSWHASQAALKLQGIERELLQLNRALARLVPASMQSHFDQGLADANTQLREADVLGEGEPIRGSFALVSSERAQVIVRETADDLAKAARTTLDTTRRAVREIQAVGLDKRGVRDLIARGTIEGQPKATLATLRKWCINAADKEGKLYTVNASGEAMAHDPRAYADMVFQTRSAESANIATLERLDDKGIQYVKITGSNSSNFCTAFVGKVYYTGPGNDPLGLYPHIRELPDGGPPFHPRCTKRYVAFVVDLMSAKQIEAGKPDAATTELHGQSRNEAQKRFVAAQPAKQPPKPPTPAQIERQKQDDQLVTVINRTGGPGETIPKRRDGK